MTEGVPPLRRPRRLAGALLGACIAVAATAVAAPDPALSAPPGQVAMVPAPASAAEQADPAQPLSAADIGRYRRIFALQEAGQMAEADALIKALDSDVLMGHVLFQRYMHPTAWRSSFAELRDWMAAYADHPEADKVHALARQRGGGAVTPPARTGLLTGNGGVDHQVWLPRSGYDHLSAADRKRAIGLWSAFRKWLTRGATLHAREVVEDKDALRLLTKLDHDRMRAALAYAYFIDGLDDLTVEWATRAAEGSGDRAPTAFWAAGLAEWRQGNLAAAARWFERLAKAEHASPWLRSGGGYWAARAYLRTRQPAKVAALLTLAAEDSRTFYGLLARRALGLPLPFQWRDGALTQTEAATLAAAPGGQRALALVQVGRLDLAETELRRLYPEAGPRLAAAITALADVAGMPSLAMRLGFLREDSDPDGEGADEGFGAEPDGLAAAARYPVPPWQPDGGWAIDRALVYAFIRQESAFNPDARSWAGARGLMQLMPGTARLMRDHIGLTIDDGSLHEPSINLALGQAYIDRLLREPGIDGNLFYLAVAYNAGPGNLQKWLARERHMDDPLLFIEAIPSRETRQFVERVLANFWIYRHRMGQPLISLDAVVAGEWPLYTAADRDDPAMAEAAYVEDF